MEEEIPISIKVKKDKYDKKVYTLCSKDCPFLEASDLFRTPTISRCTIFNSEIDTSCREYGQDVVFLRCQQCIRSFE